MTGLLGGLRRFLSQHPASFYWIGYSGGADSHVLLDLCARLGSQGARFGAVHVNHNLHPDAGRWAEHCESVCGRLRLPCRVLSVEARPGAGESPEEAARNVRYRAWEEWLEAGAALLLAQHQDDQAETVLLQLLRGAGPGGLAGMPPAAELGAGRLLRPLLHVPRRTLLDYAQSGRLDWIEDPANRDLAFDRNYLRHRIFPLIRARWPACARTIARSARHCGEARALLDETLTPLLQTAIDAGGGLDASVLAGLDRPRSRWLLRAWLKQRGFRSPSEVLLERIATEAVTAATDRQPRIEWPEGQIRRYRGRLYALSPQPLPEPDWQVDWDGDTPMKLPGGGELESVPAFGKGIAKRVWRGGGIQIRYRRGGERCRLPGREGRRCLKKLFQERGVPPWMRGRLPLIFIRGELAAVADLWVCEPFVADPGEEGISLYWKVSGGFAYDAVVIES
ncbi:MAG: tRNA lysidine(34) synthetase TilS [Methylohalobius sp. ZOD2]|nr:tRNA lysidine(34) synthetase TilS [Methylothermaceae bacterium]